MQDGPANIARWLCSYTGTPTEHPKILLYRLNKNITSYLFSWILFCLHTFSIPLTGIIYCIKTSMGLHLLYVQCKNNYMNSQFHFYFFFIRNYLSIPWKYCGTLDTSIFGIKICMFLIWNTCYEIPIMGEWSKFENFSLWQIARKSLSRCGVKHSNSMLTTFQILKSLGVSNDFQTRY